MDRKIPRRDFVKGTLGILGGIAAQVASARLALGEKLRKPRPRPRLATLTIDSLSITPGSQWPLDSANGMVAARDKVGYENQQADRIVFIESGVDVPSSDTEGTWSGTPQVQTDFSP